MRLAIDTGGTFTDLLIEDEDGGLHLFKSPTTPAHPIDGVLAAVSLAASAFGSTPAALLGRTSHLTYATTYAINALITGTTARTAFLVTAGHRDMLVFREGGRDEPFNHSRVFPPPYVPRSLTFEVSERIDAQGDVLHPLELPVLVETCAALREADIEAVGVCLLWSVVNPAHELLVETTLAEQLPDVSVTLSHRINPALREYRRASSAVVDASLKPRMSKHLRELERSLREAGLAGRLSVVTSSGTLREAIDVAAAPIHLLASGPAMAPVAGRHYAEREVGSDSAIVVDAGGTTFDISVVRRGAIPRTRETWIGPRFVGTMTGFPSVDVRSIGAGGGSIAWVDEHALLHVGPISAGADPGPACYGRGGTVPTVTDASVVLGHIDPAYFLGGALPLNAGAARTAVEHGVARALDLDVEVAAAAILELATQHMVSAIEALTVHQGIDPRGGVLVAGGGAAGLNAAFIARRLGCREVVFPDTAAALSAAGALLSDLSYDAYAASWLTSEQFAASEVNATLGRLESECRAALGELPPGSPAPVLEYHADARYARQIWELELPLPTARFGGGDDVKRLREAFDALHQEVFAIAEPATAVEIVGWGARASVRIAPEAIGSVTFPSHSAEVRHRRIVLPDTGAVEVDVRRLGTVPVDEELNGPALVESPVTTIVVPAGDRYRRTLSGALVVHPQTSTDYY